MWFFCIGIAVVAVGAFLSLAAAGHSKIASWSAAFCAMVGSVLCVIDAIRAMSGGCLVEVHLPWSIPFGSAVIGLDPLSAIFVATIAAVVFAAALYGVQYFSGSHGGMCVGVSWFFFNLLVASMFAVVVARNGFLFVVFWELMSLTSFALVITEYGSESTRRAGWVYLIAMHLGTACLLVLFLLLGRRFGSLDFARFSIDSGAATAAFLLAVIGFGTKAGFLPLHVWLPEAHPAAPSHVSAVMSGVMIKTGIYGLLRTLTFLGEMPAWWGWTILGIGAASGVLGVLFALAQHDLKRLLAYHSVENIGIIAIGIGVGMLGLSYHIPAMAALGFLGALLHIINHALFKSLLFFGAGAVQQATDTRDMDRLGGLLKRMPTTGTTFLVGACAISGLPPLNGFVSELLIYLAAIAGVVELDRSAGMQRVMLCVIAIGGLALIGGLAAACFTKAFGCVFLGEPRTEQAAGSREVGRLMRGAMLMLSGACIFVALSAPLWPNALRSCVAAIDPAAFAEIAELVQRQAVFPLSVLCVASWGLLIVVALLAVLRKTLLSNKTVQQAATWDCGYIVPTPRMQYTASSFADPLVLLFRMFLRTKNRLHEPDGLFPRQAAFRSETPDLFRDYFYRPVFSGIGWLASRLRWLQHGRIQLYVLYIALTILVLLIWKLG